MKDFDLRKEKDWNALKTNRGIFLKAQREICQNNHGDHWHTEGRDEEQELYQAYLLEEIDEEIQDKKLENQKNLLIDALRSESADINFPPEERGSYKSHQINYNDFCKILNNFSRIRFCLLLGMRKFGSNIQQYIFKYELEKYGLAVRKSDMRVIELLSSKQSFKDQKDKCIDLYTDPDCAALLNYFSDLTVYGHETAFPKPRTTKRELPAPSDSGCFSSPPRKKTLSSKKLNTSPSINPHTQPNDTSKSSTIELVQDALKTITMQWLKPKNIYNKCGFFGLWCRDWRPEEKALQNLIDKKIQDKTPLHWEDDLLNDIDNLKSLQRIKRHIQLLEHAHKTNPTIVSKELIETVKKYRADRKIAETGKSSYKKL